MTRWLLHAGRVEWKVSEDTKSNPFWRKLCELEDSLCGSQFFPFSHSDAGGANDALSHAQAKSRM